VRPELFLPSPGQDPIGARVKRIGEEQAGRALPNSVPAKGHPSKYYFDGTQGRDPDWTPAFAGEQ